MRNFIFILLALAVSLAIHYLTLDNLNKHLAAKKLQYPTSNKKTKDKKAYTAVKYVKLVDPQGKPGKIKKKVEPLVNNIPKEAEKIKRIKRAVKKDQKLSKIKTVKLPPQESKVDLKKLFTKKQETKIKKEPLFSPKDTQKQIVKQEKKKVKKLDTMTQKYIKLYGEKYYAFSKEQRKYIKNNISSIGKITQKYLRYPRVSVRTKQSGTNVVEFKLHPNGDITDLRLVDSSNYTALDQNSVNTIKIAYAEYPRPSEPTWIRIFVRYILY